MTKIEEFVTEKLSADPARHEELGVRMNVDACGDIVKTVLIVGRGDGKPSPWVEVNFHYTAKYAGKMFESTFDELQPRVALLRCISDRVASGLPSCLVDEYERRALPHGIEIAMLQMYQGEKAKIELKGQYAPFGEKGDAEKGIPPNAAIEYEVELRSWVALHDVFGDGSMFIKPLHTSMPSDKPTDIDMITMRYCGRILGSAQTFINQGFGCSWDDDVDYSFVLKRCQLKDIEPEGLRVSMKEMWKGCSYSVFLAAKHAFGQDDVRVLDTMIPGGSKVEFKVEICDVSFVQDLTNDGGVLLEVLSKSSGLQVQRPTERTTCIITYQSAVQGDAPQAGRQYESHEDRYVQIGQIDTPLTDGLERALQSMLKGQACIVRVAPEYAYGHEGLQDSNGSVRVAADRHVEHRVTLLDFYASDKGGVQSLPFREQIQVANEIKEVGNALFKSSLPTQVRRAICRYEAVDRILLVPDHKAEESLKSAAARIRCSALVNAAACHVLLKNWRACIASCSKALEMEQKHAKALYRRALAYLQLGRVHEAEVDMQALLAQPSAADDPAVQVLRQRVRKEIKAGNKESVFNNILR